MKKLAVFDVDGTILNSTSLFDKAAIEFSKINNLPETNVKAVHIGYSNPDNFDFGWGVSKAEQRELLKGLSSYFDVVHSKIIPDLYDGVKETLHKLHDDGHVLAIATSKPGKLLDMVLEGHAIKGLFSASRSWDDVDNRQLKPKPAGDMLQSIMDELGFSPENTIMVGDTNLDILMGKSANSKTIAVTWGAQSKEALSESKPDFIVEGKFEDIMPLIA